MQYKKNNSLAAKRKTALVTAIAAAKEKKGDLEIIIKAEESQREEVARQLERIGKVSHFYTLIPYISLKCDADYADILRKASSGTVSDSVFEKTFRSIMPAISAIDISSAISIPHVKAKTASAAAAIHHNGRNGMKSGLWNLDAIGAYEAQGYGTGQDVRIAIIDSGVDYGHSQLSDRFGGEKGYDFVKNDSEPMDENGHGTHVAGIVAGRDYGVAPGLILYAVRVLDGQGSGSEADAVAGIEWCVKNNIDVANMSFGGPYASQALEEICQYAWQHGVLLVAAAGNNGYGANYPAAFGESVIAVAAVDEELKHPEFSNIFETNDISAPGVNVLSTYLGESYATLSGTSMASPHVTGALGLAMSVGGGDDDLESVLKEKAENLGANEIFGAGLVKVNRMAEYLSGAAKSKYGNSQSIVKDYLALEKKADVAIGRFASDALSEIKRMLS